MKEKDGIKVAGNFLYKYRGNGTVAIAKKAQLSNFAGQMEVNLKMEGVANRTGFNTGLNYNGMLYEGIIFEAIPEDELIRILESE